ncbi:MAG TPA: twin-arginine translocase TatA/TatE family subunit [Pyrinomonadaceae bacterium]|jgi:sec-independent protein translocase protein TatA|nr:twin-arginine translocase TatA/TatE family subunit [Pyrinomonadaceae bacterium]
MLGGWEWIVIVAAVFLLFGASRLPQLAKSLGQSRKAFKEGMRDAEDEYEEEQAQKKIAAPSVTSATSMTDEQLMEEIARRRAETKQS